MSDKCAVCGDSSTPPTTPCHTCLRPCHLRCSGKKVGVPCNLCRQQQQQQKPQQHNETKSKLKLKSRQSSTTLTPSSSAAAARSRQVSARITPTSLQRSTPAENRGTPHPRAPLLASASSATAKHSPSSLTHCYARH